MGYLDSFADPLFKTDDQGRIVFFPSGKLAKGRIVPDQATATRLRNTVKYGMPVLIVLVVAAVLWFGMPIGLAVAVGIGVLYQVFMQIQVRNLPRSDARLTFAEVRERQARALGLRWLIPMAIISAILAASAAFLAATDPESLYVGLFGAVFFGVCLVAFLYMIRLRGRAS
jgi:hypothetical protein